MNLPDKFLPIDEEGYGLLNESRITDPNVSRELYQNLKIAENGAFESSIQGNRVLVEAFDEPLIARHMTAWTISTPFEVEFSFDPSTLTVDDWDRFHGVTKQGIPFVLSRTAQKELFDLCDDYDDDSITVAGKKYLIRHQFSAIDPAVATENYWSQIYRNEKPRWENDGPAEAFVDMLPRLKIPKTRVLVLGCGSGNDAALFAQQGHVVTAVDISPEAIALGKKKYADLNINWVQSDVFALGENYNKQFDLVVEHTCFCAIDPKRRNDLVATWKRVLADKGHLLAVLFTMENRASPPFGGTEWEYRERLKKSFHFLFWGRWNKSLENRQGKELLIYAQARDRL